MRSPPPEETYRVDRRSSENNRDPHILDVPGWVLVRINGDRITGVIYKLNIFPILLGSVK